MYPGFEEQLVLEPVQISKSRHPRAKRASSSISASCDRLCTAIVGGANKQQGLEQQSFGCQVTVRVAAAAVDMLVIELKTPYSCQH